MKIPFQVVRIHATGQDVLREGVVDSPLWDEYREYRSEDGILRVTEALYCALRDDYKKDLESSLPSNG